MTAARAVVTCTNCGDETRLDQLDAGKACPGCGQPIDPDAPTKIPTEMVKGDWDKLHGEDYEPAAGYSYTQDEVSEPERDVEAVTEVLIAAEPKDVLTVTIGADIFEQTVDLFVLSHERDKGPFDHRVSLVPKPREDGWTRLYTTVIGDHDTDPWEVVSAPYDLGGDRTLDMRDFAANGWIIDAEPTDGEADRVDQGVDDGE